MTQGEILGLSQPLWDCPASSRTEAEFCPCFGEIWNPHPSGALGLLLSASLHLLCLFALLVLGMWKVEPFPSFKLRTVMSLTAPSVSRAVRLPPFRIKHVVGNRGGVGGVRSAAPTTKGNPPSPAPQQPKQANANPRAQLLMPPAIDVQKSFKPQDVKLLFAGLPEAADFNSHFKGPGSDGGIGSGKGAGSGEGQGSGTGPGNGGGTGGGQAGRRFIPSHGITAPQLVKRIEPEYTRLAFDARLQGKVTLEVVIGVSGQVQVVRVVKGLSMGLDEKAVEAVRQWQFRPAMREGLPFALTGQIDVYFRLE